MANHTGIQYTDFLERTLLLLSEDILLKAQERHVPFA
jgi:hypothetical protein